jgi:hypothetical protein
LPFTATTGRRVRARVYDSLGGATSTFGASHGRLAGLTLAKKAAKRELIAPKGNKRFIRRRADGTIKESDDVGNS